MTPDRKSQASGHGRLLAKSPTVPHSGLLVEDNGKISLVLDKTSCAAFNTSAYSPSHSTWFAGTVLREILDVVDHQQCKASRRTAPDI